MKNQIIAGVVACIFTLSLCGCNLSNTPAVETTPTAQAPEPTSDGTTNNSQPTGNSVDFSKLSPITGTAYDGTYKPVLLMIENEKNARPQDGLAEADVVYEAMVEGGITRFIAIFQSELPEKAGPVRSCRVPFADIAREWDGLLIHYGGPSTGSYSVYQRFITDGIKQRIDGVKSNVKAYIDPTRKAPHDKYLNIATEQALYNYTPTERRFSFTSALAAGEEINSIEIDYNSSGIVLYKFDAKKNIYNRYQNGDLVSNRINGKKVEASNVIIQVCNESIYSDSTAGHVKIDIIGSGSATIYRNGKKINAHWEKISAEARTIYYGEDNKEIPLSPGKTWIQIVSDKTKITDNK